MKYDEEKFNSAVNGYKEILGNVKAKSFLVVFDIKNKKAFFSIAPLSRAIHELGADMNAIGVNKKSETLDALCNIWKIFKQNKGGKFDEKTQALMDFVDEVEKRAKGQFIGLFEEPDYILEAKEFGFEHSFTLPFKDNWSKKYRSKELNKTCKKIWKDVYNLKKDEKVSIGFVLIQKDGMLGHPLEDYLDSYAIAWGMMFNCKNDVVMTAYTQRSSMLDKGESISELKATLLGCELCKDADEAVFKKYKKLSKLVGLERIKSIDASFSIIGKGYPGKHLFGEIIGYPSLNKKTRWQSPGQMVYKLDYYPQTVLDEREPLARVGFTETLPIDVFVETCNVDWKKMRERNWKIKEIADKCKVIRVSSAKVDGFKTDFEVGLVRKDKIRRWVRPDDADVREKINSEYLKKTGVKAGNMANLPAGESFVTPEYVKGTIGGDVVISIDQSYLLSDKYPLVIKSDGKRYKIIKGPKEIIKKLEEKKKQAWQLILNQERYKSLPQEIVDLKKRNFNKIGEFSINTNPSAKLCDYLIVNEKIARMIHIALGSGFEPDRATEYHTDIVINSPRQKMDIYGVDDSGKKYWIIKKGKFVI